jgi:hypothetical protein
MLLDRQTTDVYSCEILNQCVSLITNFSLFPVYMERTTSLLVHASPMIFSSVLVFISIILSEDVLEVPNIC